MRIDRFNDSGLDGLYISFVDEYREPDHEAEIAPGVTGGYDSFGELLFVEFAGNASLKVSSIDRLVANGFKAVEVRETEAERDRL